jgi:hypothetical protein
MAFCGDIPEDLHLAYKVYAITANENLINRFIRKKEDRVKVEIVICNSFLDHLEEIQLV